MKTLQRFKSNSFTFKQWSRKPYAVFQSLQKIVAIGALIFTYTLLSSDLSMAQTDTASTYLRYQKLDEIVISARRTPVAFREASRLISTIDEESLNRMPVHSVTDALEYVPGIDLRQRGVNGVQADLRMRGGSFDQNLILLNGINMTDPQTGHHNLNLPLSIQSVDKIEILHGPAARVFGANAFSGAINFITATRNTNFARGHISGGQYGLFNAGASANITMDNTRHFLAAGYKKAGDYSNKTSTDFNRYNAFYHGKINYTNYRLALQLGHSAKDFAANTFYTPYYNNQYEETSTNFAAITGKFKGTWNLEHKMYWRRHLDRYILKRDDPDFYQNHHQTNTLGGNVNAWQINGLGKTALGIDYRYEGLLSNNLGTPMQQTRPVPYASDAQYTKSDKRSNISFFAEQNTEWGNLNISGGMLINWNSMYPDQLRFYPGMDISYKFNPPVSLYASINRSLRLPTFTDMYYSGPTNIGNPDLKPEKAWTGELGAKYLQKGLMANIAIFRRQGKAIIDWLWMAEQEKWHTQNLTELQTTGLEVSGNFTPQNFGMHHEFIQQISLAYSYIDIAKADENIISNYALDNLQHKLSLNIRHKVYSKLTAEWFAGYFNRNGEYLVYNEEKGSTEEHPYSDHWQVDARLSWNGEGWNAYMEATNLLDVTYHDTGNAPQPGRWMKAGISIRTDW